MIVLPDFFPKFSLDQLLKNNDAESRTGLESSSDC